MAKSKLVTVNEKNADTVADGYKKIENGVVTVTRLRFCYPQIWRKFRVDRWHTASYLYTNKSMH